MSGLIGSMGGRSGLIGNTAVIYEEGYHLCVVKGTGSGGTTASLASGSDELAYRRIGDWCNIQGTIQVTDTAGLSGTKYFSLPFTCAQNTGHSGSEYWGVAVPTYSVNYPGTFCAAQASPNNAWFEVYGIQDGGTTANIIHTGYYRVNFTYDIKPTA